MRNYNKLPYTYKGADACWEANIISLGQVIPCFLWTRRFIPVFTKTHQSSLS